MSKRKVSVEDKIYAVNLYLDGKESQRRIAHMFDVSLASVQQWIRNYEFMGANAFTLKGNKKYSKDLFSERSRENFRNLFGYGKRQNTGRKSLNLFSAQLYTSKTGAIAFFEES